MNPYLLTYVNAPSPVSPHLAGKKMMENYSILLLLDAQPDWLAKSRPERADFYHSYLQPLFHQYASTCRIRLFDSEFFHARISDFILIETSNLADYQDLIEQLRDTAFYSVPYFAVRDIIVAKENAFLEYNARQGIA
ncbi:hypothetical protein CRP01_19525 [Flavilitoribacter nigricans DSM 23189 = NBRC 102662]|uniref:DUF1330 domain-containing protein n=2 Tax=Flavilitoribacter TaxID=2762562 RepID=A0A2D0N8J0_FLAN2|nr:hypothetical protein CRP01_19525 [Flavilitoribacter nigricans DSM 23189 = NBRC 102662]